MATSSKTPPDAVILTLAIGPRRLWLCDERMAAQHEAEQKLSAVTSRPSMTSTTNGVLGREMVRAHRPSHSNNVIVHWPDGHTTQRPRQYIEDLKAMFVWAPDTRTQGAPCENRTTRVDRRHCVMEGTFTQPMPTGKAKPIRPRPAKLTRSKWRPSVIGRTAVMDEEYLFWDNQEFMKQHRPRQVGGATGEMVFNLVAILVFAP